MSRVAAPENQPQIEILDDVQPKAAGQPDAAPAAAPRPRIPEEQLTAVRLLLLETGYGAREVRTELTAAAAGPDVARPRVQAALGQATIKLAPVYPQLGALGAADLAALAPTARGALDELKLLAFVSTDGLGMPDGELFAAMMAAGAPLVALFQGQLDAALSTVDPGGIKAAGAGDAAAGAKQALAGAKAELAALRAQLAAEPWDDSAAQSRDLPAAGVIAGLAAAMGLIGATPPPARAPLQPLVEELKQQVLAVREYAPNGALTHELEVRVSDVMQAVGLGERIAEDTTVGMIKTEVAAKHSYTDADVAEFEKAKSDVDRAFERLYQDRRDAIDEIDQEAGHVDPPKPTPLWQGIVTDLVFAALSAVTAGIGGALLGAAFKVEEEATSEIVKAACEIGEKGIEIAADEAADVGKDKMKEGGDEGGEAPQAESAGKGSNYFQDAFFATSKRELGQQQQQSGGRVDGVVAALRGRLADGPATKIAGLRQLVGAIDETRKLAHDSQCEESRLKYVSALAQMSLGAVKVERDGREVDESNLGAGLGLEGSVEVDDPVEYVKNLAGVISMEGEMDGDGAPDAPIGLTRAWVKGLNDSQRAHLAKENLIAANLPIRLRVLVYDGTLDTTMVMGRGESGDVWAGEGIRGDQWLSARGGSPDKVDQGAMVSAARQILETLCARSLESLHVELED